MPSYRYTVVNQENKKLAGLINAPNEDEARRELNSLGFSILALSEYQATPAAVAPAKTKFEFTALDKKGKKVVGTIPATDRLSAYRKLISEYNFKVLSLYQSDLSQAEKQKLQLAGVTDLENQYAQEKEITMVAKGEAEDNAKKAKQAQLVKDVEQLIEQIKQLLDRHQADLQPQQKKAIDDLFGKILRIKTSTNLNFIKESCRELLKKLQQDEIVQDSENKPLLQSKMRLESKKILLNLQRIDTNKSNVREKMEAIIHRLEKKSPGFRWLERFMQSRLSKIFNRPPEYETLLNLKQQLGTVRSQLVDYLKIWLTSQAEVKSEASHVIHHLWDERKKIKRQINKIRRQAAPKDLAKMASHGGNFLSELNAFTGWLLTFYLIYYFLSIYISTKPLIGTPSYYFQLFNSQLLKYLITGIFVLHSSTALKLTFFKNNRLATGIIFPTGFLLFLLIVFNL